MAKAFHGRIEDTVDALIIFEGCRQGILPILNRRLLAAERGEIVQHLPQQQKLIDYPPLGSSSDQRDNPHQGSTSSRRHKNNNSNRYDVAETFQIQPLIEPGSVFVFDEDESGICRWTDGRIWSPSRICGNFLVYRELLRKVPDQKCRTPTDKAKMKNGAALADQALRQKVEEEHLTVLGCMKGTYVLKKNGLIKKTICVKGTTVPMPTELQRLWTNKKLNEHTTVPGFAVGGMQHLVCYEKEGAMQGLHRPRDYKELRDLTLSKSFILIQKYRNPMVILAPDSHSSILDPFDEYVGNDRVTEGHHQSRSETLRKPQKKRKSAKKPSRTRKAKVAKSEEPSKVEPEPETEESSPDLSEPEGDEQEEQQVNGEIDEPQELGTSASSSSQGPPLPPTVAEQRSNRVVPPHSPRVKKETLMTPAEAFDVVGHPYPTRGAERRMRDREQARTTESTSQKVMPEELVRRGAYRSSRQTEVARHASERAYEHSYSAGESHLTAGAYEKDNQRSLPPLPQQISSSASMSRDDLRRHDGSHLMMGPVTTGPSSAQIAAPGSSASSWNSMYPTHSDEHQQQQSYARSESANHYGPVSYPSSSTYEPYQPPEPVDQLYTPSGTFLGYPMSMSRYPLANSLRSSSFPVGVLGQTFHPQPWYPPTYQNHQGSTVHETFLPHSRSCECCSIPVDRESEVTPWGDLSNHHGIKVESNDNAPVTDMPDNGRSGPYMAIHNSVHYVTDQSDNQAGTRSQQAGAQGPNNDGAELSTQDEQELSLQLSSCEMHHRPIFTSETGHLQSDFQHREDFGYSWSSVNNAGFSVAEQIPPSPPSSDHGEAQQALGASEFLLHSHGQPSFLDSSQSRLSQTEQEREDIVLGSDTGFEPLSAHYQGEGVHEDLSFYSDLRSRGGLEPTSSDSAATQPMSDPVVPGEVSRPASPLIDGEDVSSLIMEEAIETCL
ncbi:hypothetical protein BGZ83_010507 [Gryganskiella cystojenkinii]|nr:hypothetical protein BGZ83_010507 [Gryganskiella cystojenkinii]